MDQTDFLFAAYCQLNDDVASGGGEEPNLFEIIAASFKSLNLATILTRIPDKEPYLGHPAHVTLMNISKTLHTEPDRIRIPLRDALVAAVDTIVVNCVPNRFAYVCEPKTILLYRTKAPVRWDETSSKKLTTLMIDTADKSQSRMLTSGRHGGACLLLLSAVS